MMNHLTEQDRALWEAAERATPGPWEAGDPWGVAGVLPERFGESRCAYCDRGELVWQGVRAINGKPMLAHRHRVEPYNPEHVITNHAGVSVAGNYDYEEGGIIRPEDTNYIALANPEAIKALLTRLAEAEQAKRALLDLTPGGSEFVDNIHNCKRWVGERLRSSHELLVTTTKRAREAETRLDTAVAALEAIDRRLSMYSKAKGGLEIELADATIVIQRALAAVKGGPQ